MPLRLGVTFLGMTIASFATVQLMAQQPVGPPAARPQVQAPVQQPRAQVPQPQRQAQAPGQRVPVPGAQPPVAPRAPFQLTPEETAQLDLVLRQWELQSDTIKTLTTAFTRDEFDPVFKTSKRTTGELKFKKPDKGVYRVVDPEKKEEVEHWICDGQSIYEYNHQQKLVVERKLPKELQGKAIVDGPLPFIFGAKADKLRARYFMRLAKATTQEEHQRRIENGEIWLEAYPRMQKDAANFSRADLILKQQTMLPVAIRITLPGGNKTTDHLFGEPKVNGIWDAVKDITPKVPYGWKMVEASPEQPQPGQQPPRAAQRPAGPPVPNNLRTQ